MPTDEYVVVSTAFDNSTQRKYPSENILFTEYPLQRKKDRKILLLLSSTN
jgi:hypothetical protein